MPGTSSRTPRDRPSAPAQVRPPPNRPRRIFLTKSLSDFCNLVQLHLSSKAVCPEPPITAPPCERPAALPRLRVPPSPPPRKGIRHIGSCDAAAHPLRHERADRGGSQSPPVVHSTKREAPRLWWPTQSSAEPKLHCSPLPPAPRAARSRRRAARRPPENPPRSPPPPPARARSRGQWGRGIHSSTSQLNLSRV